MWDENGFDEEQKTKNIRHANKLRNIPGYIECRIPTDEEVIIAKKYGIKIKENWNYSGLSKTSLDDNKNRILRFSVGGLGEIVVRIFLKLGNYKKLKVGVDPRPDLISYGINAGVKSCSIAFPVVPIDPTYGEIIVMFYKGIPYICGYASPKVLRKFSSVEMIYDAKLAEKSKTVFYGINECKLFKTKKELKQLIEENRKIIEKGRIITMSKDKKKKESKDKVVRIVGGKRIELVDTLAVKWRPKQLNDIVGNEGVVTSIKGMIKKRQMVRSWMFAGPTGAGKTSFSRLVAKIVNCSNLSKKGKLCGKCDSCLEDIKYHSDIREINGTVNRKIENIRSILESSTLSPRYNYRCYIIDEIQGLTFQAKEALLKPIEEPPPKTIWFLCTTEPDKLPATLTGGRTLRMFLNYPSKEELGKRLKKIAKKEFDEDIFKLFKPHFENIAEAGRCQPRDSIAMMEQISDGIVGSNYNKLSKKKVKKLVEMFMSSLGNLEFEAIRFLLCMYTKKYRLPLEMINKIDQTKLEDFMKLLNDYSHYAALYIVNKKAEKRIDRKWFYNINKIKWESALDKNKVTNFKVPLFMCNLITEAMEKVRRGLVTNHQVMLSIIYKFIEER